MLKKNRSRYAVFPAAFFITLSTVPSHSQVLFGSLVGNVADSSEGGIVVTTVQITDEQTNESRQTETKGTGVFSTYISSAPSLFVHRYSKA
jgi:hypothetical protein